MGEGVVKVAKIKFSEEQVRLLIVGQTVIVRLPDAELRLTMDQVKIELRRAAKKLKDLGVRPTGFEGFEDIFEEQEQSRMDKFNDMLQDILDKKKR